MRSLLLRINEILTIERSAFDFSSFRIKGTFSLIFTERHKHARVLTHTYTQTHVHIDGTWIYCLPKI